MSGGKAAGFILIVLGLLLLALTVTGKTFDMLAAFTAPQLLKVKSNG